LIRRSSFFFWYQSSYRGVKQVLVGVRHHRTRDGCRYRYDAFLSRVPNNLIAPDIFGMAWLIAPRRGRDSNMMR
jgi:hypothetical protein